ncbi:MAG TPA: class I SAM-dependent methyltransferase [Solirubrobacterales bacterium]|jgi:SAM-dependent methyltransferase|nr:class I SAM-dependent methyltransferase [Solirubrobacterales bacterium]
MAAEAAYLERGRESLRAIERVLPGDWSWSGKAVLDFGCGAGRVVRHLAEASDCEAWGSDISAACIDWDRRHLTPGASFVLHEEAPPLPLPDEKFDLIYALSVFTHIADEWATWLLELDRVLAPGGHVVCTLMSEGMCEAVTGEPWDEANFGMSVYEIGQSWELGGPMVIHSPWWIEEHWGRLFTIEHLQARGFVEGAAARGQDDHGVVVLRKSDGPRPSPRELEQPNPSARRELTALDHTARRLGREVAALRNQAARRRWRFRG